jgi:hypothetical protein
MPKLKVGRILSRSRKKVHLPREGKSVRGAARLASVIQAERHSEPHDALDWVLENACRNIQRNHG